MIPAQEVVFEFMLNALRLTEGVTLELFSARTGLPVSALEPVVTEAKNKKLLQDLPGWLRPTELGQRFLNDLIGMFLQ